MGKPNDYAEHARNILRRQSKVAVPMPAPSMNAGGTNAAPAFKLSAGLKPQAGGEYHPDVLHHVSMHIAERLKKLGA